MNPSEVDDLPNRILPMINFQNFNIEDFKLLSNRTQRRVSEFVGFSTEEAPLEAKDLPRLKLSEWKWSLINPRYQYLIKGAVIITLSAIGAVAMPWKLPRVWGATVLTAVAYGIINDLFACRVCPEYFTVGHVFDGRETRGRLVKTLDPNINAVAWGMVATSPLAALGGTVLSVGACISGLDEKKIMISFICTAALTLLIADLGSRIERRALEKEPRTIYLDVPNQFQPRWHANNTRNMIGYFSLTISVIAISILMGKFWFDNR